MIIQNNCGEMGMAFKVKEHNNMVEKGACKICGCCGHKETTCYEVIGYPLGQGSRGHGRGGRGGCSLGRGEHFNGKGRGGPTQETAAVAVQQESSPSSAFGTSGPSGVTKGEAGIPWLSADQI